jgi:hypothetical protein
MAWRWLLVVVLALGSGLAALEHETGAAGDRYTVAFVTVSDSPSSALPVGAEIEMSEAQALMRLTH